MPNIKNVGILTWHYYPNFGSALQAFALQHTIESLGYKASLVNYHNPKFGQESKWKNLVKILLGNTIGRYNTRFQYATLCFSHKYHKLGRLTTKETLLPKLTKKLDVIICGSDQIWAPNVYNPIYFASFTYDKTRKVSYAASIGLNDIPADLVPKYKQHLINFYAVGIREQEGKDLLKIKCGIESTVVLDPTLLVDVKTYVKMQKSIKNIRQPYLFCYFLNKEHQYKDSVQKYAKEHNLQIIGISDKVEDSKWMTRLDNLGADHFLWLINHAQTIITDSYHGAIFSLLFHKNLWIFQRFEENNLQIIGISDKVEDSKWMTRLDNLGADHFLWLINHAQTIITDSYHGAIFSLLFHKNLWIFQRFEENNPICQNSRIRQLQSNFNLKQRIISTSSRIDDSTPIDYDYFESQLKLLRASSLDFLKQALK